LVIYDNDTLYLTVSLYQDFENFDYISSISNWDSESRFRDYWCKTCLYITSVFWGSVKVILIMISPFLRRFGHSAMQRMLYCAAT